MKEFIVHDEAICVLAVYFSIMLAGFYASRVFEPEIGEDGDDDGIGVDVIFAVFWPVALLLLIIIGIPWAMFKALERLAKNTRADRPKNPGKQEK